MTFKQLVWWILVTLFVGFSFLYPFINEPEALMPPPPIKPTSTTQAIPDFSAYEQVVEKKQAFFDYLRPEVERQNDYLLNLRLQIQNMQQDYNEKGGLSSLDGKRLKWLIAEYNIEPDLSIDEQFELLMRRVDIIPADLVLVQAANESAWGTSRFAQEGYNLFGLWCFRKGCGFVPRRRNSGANHEVAKFDNLSRATYTYMRNLNRHRAYTQLRDIRRKLRANQKPITGIALSEGLMQYSERGEDYIEELQHMIRINREYITL
ncbi:glucosaminidase domain-containing protein [Alteromonas sp. ASW11-36]|uniref:Glucosaminidase domain-containing protein n=1 Tax=Alteromonas arenosi TaxID=3055817 RepID=A0ABT7SZ46_9ALTE|nr:glucosaminidase domain-containing protein [Alteromonas sp. ASW11-36]MDM7860822.1 glucosaminidase domain-containing protein [Alteromonas sp. ASW11-36]